MMESCRAGQEGGRTDGLLNENAKGDNDAEVLGDPRPQQ